ncbi:uncharacterized protein LOC131302993 [Rhododendron vialii]|uniref:uncharacterized protein LOC131302993 n=1 Tax=Rhododendron vialii TaxID=182163 RepID=UPI00265F3B85|nr:uncharacterized protein LOC131302993 [Rhododendron vialii]
MKKDSEEFVRRCKKCQMFAPIIHQPARDLSPLTSPWPFSQWGMDIGNRQAEAANKAISSRLKRRLESRRGKWAEELPRILWGYRTTPRRSTDCTPFSLAFGMEAVIPLQVGLPTMRIKNFDELVNNNSIASDLDLVEEEYENTRIKLASYQQEVAKGYNRSVYLRSLKVVEKSKKTKLMPNWEGPFRILKHLSSGNYKLEKLDGSPIAKTWNANNLKKF